MKIPLVLLGLLLSVTASVSAQNFGSDEDRSRFVERLYEKAEPGLRQPAEYIEIAKKAVHRRYGSSVMFAHFSDGIVSKRTYRNTPKAARDIICVSFVYQGTLSGGGIVGRGFVFNRDTPARPILLVLLRRDLSKIYVNVAHFKRG